jgi:hypothetical protein
MQNYNYLAIGNLLTYYILNYIFEAACATISQCTYAWVISRAKSQIKKKKSGSQIGVPNRGPKSGSQIRVLPKWGFPMGVPNGGPKWGSQMGVPNGGPKWGSQMGVPNGGPKWGSQMGVLNRGPISPSVLKCQNVKMAK